MVKIVNGEIVQDDQPPQSTNRNSYYNPTRSSSSSSPSGAYDPFPSTNGQLGSLSQRYKVFNVESELVWLVIFVVVCFLVGLLPGIVFLGILALYQNNAKADKSAASGINRLNNL